MVPDGMPHPVADERFFSRHVQLHKVPARLQAQPGAQRLIENILFVSESAADVRFDNPYIAPADAQCLPDDTADNMGNLRGGSYDDLVAFLLGITDEVLNMAVLDRRCFIPAFHLDQSRFLDRLLIVSLPDLGMLQDVVWEFLMQQRRTVLHGFLHIQHKRVFLILHLDQPQRLGSRNLIFRHHCRDVVSVEAHPLRQDQPVRHILMARIRGPGMSCRREIVLLCQVKARQDFHNARHLLGFRCVERNHFPVGNGGMQDSCNIRFSVAQIIRILTASRHLVKGVHSLYALSRIHRSTPFIPYLTHFAYFIYLLFSPEAEGVSGGDRKAP